MSNPMTPELMRQYLQVWKDLGVRKIEWGELRVEMGPETAQPTEARQDRMRAVAKTLFENPSLWPSGAPPKFPGQE